MPFKSGQDVTALMGGAAPAPAGGIDKSDPSWKRDDGSEKGTGFLGLFKLPNGGVASEYSIADSEHLKDAKGKYIDYPTLVPTLTKDEVQTVLKAAANHGSLPESIKDKAEAFALERKRKGLPLFATDAESDPSIHPDFPRVLTSSAQRKPKSGDDVTALMGANASPAAPPEEKSAGQRFVEGAASQLNPMAAVRGIAQTVAHPIDTLGSMVQSHIDQAKKAKAAYDEGRYTEAAGHLGAAALPVVGPAAAGIGERIAATGDIATGVGEGAGLVASLGVPKAIPAVASAVGRTGAAVGRAGQAVGEAASAALEHPIVQKAAQRVVKYGATGIGASAGSALGPAGTVVGGALGREFGASIAERMADKAAKAGAKTAPVAATSADIVAELSSGKAINGPAYIEKFNQLSDAEKAQVVAARQTATRARIGGAGPSTHLNQDQADFLKNVAQRQAESPAGLSPADVAQLKKQGYSEATIAKIVDAAQATPSGVPVTKGVQTPSDTAIDAIRASQTAAPEQVGPVPQTAPVVEPAPPVPAEPAKAAPFNPSTAYDAARKAFADAGETPKAGELSWITEYVRRGLSVKEAVKKVIETRKTVPSSADPAAELAAKLGTPSPAAVEEAVRARNATGRWAAR